MKENDYIYPRGTIIGILCAVLIVFGPAFFLSGCATTNPTPGPVTPYYTTNKAQQVAVALKGIVRSGVVMAYAQDTNSLAYCRAAGIALNQFVLGKDLSPTALNNALANSSAKEFKTPEIQLAITTAVGLYEVFFNDMVQANITDNSPLKITLTGFVDGINAGVADATGFVASIKAPLPRR